MNLRKRVCAAVLAAVLFTLFLPIFFTGCYTDSSVWYDDFNTALSAAQAENKDIFLLFTGLKWDTVSEELQADIFDTEEFKRDAGKNHVLLRIDIEYITSPSAGQSSKNYRLATNMGVVAAPSALLVTKAGQPFAFLPMTTSTKTPADVLKLIRTERRNEKKVNALYAKMQKASGTAKIKATDAYIEAIPERFHMTLMDLFADIVDSDPENKSGLLGKYKVRKAAFDGAMQAASGDYDGAVNTFLVLLGESDLLTPSQIQELYYAAAYYAMQSTKVSKEDVKTYLQQAYNAAPDSSMSADLLSLIDSFSNIRNAQAQEKADAGNTGAETESEPKKK